MAFADDFDGYAQAGGFHERAEIARAPNMDSIVELRIAMFFAVRAMRHCDDEFDVGEYNLFRIYIARIREILSEGDSAPAGLDVAAPTEKDAEMSSSPVSKSFSFGGCSLGRLSPKLESLGPETKVLNITLSFEDALKLNLAIDECVRKLNSYKRSTAAGKRSALNLAVHLDQARITINEGKL